MALLSIVSEKVVMRYQEYDPPSELAQWVKLFWVFENQANESHPETIVADGFPELIIHFRSPFSEVGHSGRSLRQPTAVVCGQLTRPLVLHSSIDAGMIGIRFQPSGMAPFLSTSMQALTDLRVSANDLFADLDQLIDEIVESTDDSQRIAACNRFLFRSMTADCQDLSVRRSLEIIRKSRGTITVESLADLAGKSRRSLELAFQREVGTSPKMYCRVTRFRHIFDAISDPDASLNWVKIALDTGYFDQSHLIRDFQQFAGSSPTVFLTEQSPFADSINQIR